MDSMRWSECSSHEHSGAPTIKNHSVTHFGNYLFCFGGYDGRRNHMTLLIYSIAEHRWIRPLIMQPGSPGETNNGGSSSSFMDSTSIVVQGTPPPGRNGHSATLAADPADEENGRIIIIGGWLGTGPLAASDMHVLDISAGGRQLRWYQPAPKGTPPGPCNMHSADYVPAKREVYVFRGGNGREYLNDLHALHVDTLTWRRVETTGAIPQQRANHSSAMLEHELIVFGGWNGTQRLNDIHILDTVTSTWTCPRVGGVLPHPRAGMTLTSLRGRLFLFGGSGTSAKCFQDLQILDRKEMAWLDVSQYDPATRSSRQQNMMDPYDEPDNRYRFGGNNIYGDGGGGTGGRSNRYDATGQDDGSFGAGNVGGGLVAYDEDADTARPQQGGPTDENRDTAPPTSFAASSPSGSSLGDWRSRDMGLAHHPRGTVHASPNPNDEDTVPTVLVRGRGPGRRAGHTATAVHRKIYVFGGSCGSDYLNDFFVLDTDPPPHATVTEPNSLQLLERRLRHFFNDEEFSDVTFVVQGQKVYGHKMVLSIVSDCFRAMFTAGFRESEAMEIEIPDCSHATFLAVMEYIYTGSLPKQWSVLDSADRDRSLARFVEMLEVADRFFLDHLKQICECQLQPAVCQETVEYLLTVAQKTNAGQLQAVCEHYQRNLLQQEHQQQQQQQAP